MSAEENHRKQAVYLEWWTRNTTQILLDRDQLKSLADLMFNAGRLCEIQKRENQDDCNR